MVELGQSGDVRLDGSLRVDDVFCAKGDVVLGSRPDDTVVFEVPLLPALVGPGPDRGEDLVQAFQTTMNSIDASGSVQLGDDDDDTVTVYGKPRVVNNDDKVVFTTDPQTGTYVDGNLEVTQSSKFDGSATIGNPDETFFMFGSAFVEGPTTVWGTLDVVGDAHFSNLWGANVLWRACGCRTRPARRRSASTRAAATCPPPARSSSAATPPLPGAAASPPRGYHHLHGEVHMSGSLAARRTAVKDSVDIDGGLTVLSNAAPRARAGPGRRPSAGRSRYGHRRGRRFTDRLRRGC